MSGRFRIFWLMIFLASMCAVPSVALSVRIKDIVSIQGVRPNQLFGYGLVIGLNGSGDKSGTEFTLQGLANMLEYTGIRVNPGDMKVKNVAAVIGDAKSLEGGTLLLTSLKGVDNNVYALAQGPLSVGGYSVGGAAGGGVQKNHPTVGSIPGGATVEREIPVQLSSKNALTMLLNEPDFNTASTIAGVINDHFGDGSIAAIDSGTLEFKVPLTYRNRVVELIAQMGQLQVSTDSKAKIVVNARTGTVVIGENVRISRVAVAHGNLSIQIEENWNVSQPLPFAPSGLGGSAEQLGHGVVVSPGGDTVVTPNSVVNVSEDDNRLMMVNGGNTIEQLVKALNAIGVTPRDLITILQAMQAAGALQAELEII